MTEFSHFLDEFEWRGLLHQSAGQGLREHIAVKGRVAYCGFDPTAPSLTVGNYNSINLLRHWQNHGHKPIVLMGGGTGMIGDPSGKDSERQLLTAEQVQENIECQKAIFSKFLDFDPKRENCAVIVNNNDWLSKLGYIEVLRDVGKHFSVNAMIQKDSVRDRLQNREQGISYTEFSYMLMQAYDFLHLYREHGCTVQLAGSDQYGNVVAGMDLIRRENSGNTEADSAYAITSPLLTTADGKKFGKTERGAIWLTADRTSPYAYYQFWIKSDDSLVVEYLKRLTHLSKAEIGELGAAHEAAPHKREAHRALARAMTDMLHGQGERQKVERATELLFGGGDLADIDPNLLQDIFADVPHSEHQLSQLDGEGLAIADLVSETSLANSKRQARDYVKAGAVTVNGRKYEASHRLQRSDLLHGKLLLLRRGKSNWHATSWR